MCFSHIVKTNGKHRKNVFYDIDLKFILITEIRQSRKHNIGFRRASTNILQTPIIAAKYRFRILKRTFCGHAAVSSVKKFEYRSFKNRIINTLSLTETVFVSINQKPRLLFIAPTQRKKTPPPLKLKKFT